MCLAEYHTMKIVFAKALDLLVFGENHGAWPYLLAALVISHSSREIFKPTATIACHGC